MIHDANKLVDAINSSMISRKGGRSMVGLSIQWLYTFNVWRSKSLVGQISQFYLPPQYIYILGG